MRVIHNQAGVFGKYRLINQKGMNPNMFMDPTFIEFNQRMMHCESEEEYNQIQRDFAPYLQEKMSDPAFIMIMQPQMNPMIRVMRNFKHQKELK